MEHEQDGHLSVVKCLMKLLAAGYRTANLTFLTLLLLFPLTARDAMAAPAHPGDLDASFGGDGEVLTDFGSRQDSATAIVMQPDGKIVVAGKSRASSSSVLPEAVALARYLPNGELDVDFGADGKVLTNIGMNVAGVVLQSDGKIVVAGDNFAGIFPAEGGNIVLVRYLPNGELDATFNGDGIVITDLGDSAFITALALQNDGKIVVGGSTTGLAVTSFSGLKEVSEFLVVRYLPDGTPDASFGDNGFVTTLIDEFHSESDSNNIYSLAIQSDGKILAGGSIGSARALRDGAVTVVRYLPDGTSDASFGGPSTDVGNFITGEGWVAFRINYTIFASFDGGITLARALAVQPNGKIVIAANGGNKTPNVRRRGPSVHRLL